MKKSAYLLLFLSLIFSSGSKAQTFIDGMEDVPVAPDFVQIQTDTITFGGVDSHFLEATLVSENLDEKDSYITYYTDTLPQFGWNLAKKTDLKLVFYRGKETLEITREYAKPLTLRVNIFGEN